MNKFTFLEKTTLTQIVTGHTLWISGLICFLLYIFLTIHLGYLVFGGIMIFIGLYLISRVGVEINMDKRIYREIFLIFWGKSGTWKSFPEIQYLSIFRTRVTQRIGGRGFNSTATATLSDIVIKINLFTENNKPVTMYMTKDETIAFQIAEKFNTFYGTEIVNKLN